MFNVKVIPVLIAGVFYLLKNAFQFSPLYINIINDLLAVPVFLVVMEFLMKRIYGNRFRFSILHVISTAAVISILFEGIFPLVSNKTTADVMDVLWYFTGAFVYFYLISVVKWKTGPQADTRMQRSRSFGIR